MSPTAMACFAPNGMAGFGSVAIAEWRRGGHPISGRTLRGYVETLRRSMIPRRSPGLRNVGLRARCLLGEQGIEVDKLRIVSLGFA